MKLSLVTFLLAFGCVSCAKVEAPAFVPGEKMTFPVQSTGVLSHLGKRMLKNCVTDDAQVQKDCTDRTELRIETCNVSEPAVFKTELEYKDYARKYLKCVMPKPVCFGL